MNYPFPAAASQHLDGTLIPDHLNPLGLGVPGAGGFKVRPPLPLSLPLGVGGLSSPDLPQGERGGSVS